MLRRKGRFSKMNETSLQFLPCRSSTAKVVRACNGRSGSFGVASGSHANLYESEYGMLRSNETMRTFGFQGTGYIWRFSSEWTRLWNKAIGR